MASTSAITGKIIGHDGTNSTPCKLCHKSNPKMKLYGQMKEHAQFRAVYEWLKHEMPVLSESASICLPCIKQIQRNHNKPGFTPRWLPKPIPSPQKCNLEHCQAAVHCQTSLVTVEELEKLLKDRVTTFTVTTSKQSIGLCYDHYKQMYAHLNYIASCDSCGTRPKKGEVFTRHCPSPTVVNRYLSHVSAEASTLTSSSTICLPCYKYFQSIVKQPTSACEPKSLLAANDLDTIITTLSQQIDSLRVRGENLESIEVYELVMCLTAQNLATVMKADEAMLLSALYQSFVNKVLAESVYYPSLHPVEEQNIPRRRWVLSRLYFHFGDVLAVTCKHDRFGSLLFHKKCDLIKALSAALGKGKSHSASKGDEKHPLGEKPLMASSEKPTCSCSIEEQIENVSAYLNDKMHRQAKTLMAHFQNIPQRYATFSMALYKEMVDPVLLHFIQKVTQSVRNRRRKLFPSEAEMTQTKQVRQLYLLSTMLFCTNTQCSMPFHTLLTEAILCHGGTQELVKILNRVGAVASIDTNQRVATQAVQARMAQGIFTEIEEKALSIVSIDNIDILQPHAFVSCTDATRSWHGTSVQCVQPLPITGILEEEELNALTRPMPRKHPAPSPTASPIPVEKSKRRRRTLTELPSPHSSLSIPQVHHTLTCDHSTYDMHARPLQVDDFTLSPIEKASMNLLKEDVFKCMLLKQTHQAMHHLPSLQSLLHCIRKQTNNSEESKVAYVEISSERADSKPTLVNILGKVYQTFVVQQRQKWLLVVGDAKTYDLIRNIRSEYGDQMKWLIPWPGDWHILLNYQKALMKPYVDAGLTKLGEVTQHRNETLSSLIKCTNFRRTHNFLVQTMEAFYRFFLSLYIADKNKHSSVLESYNEEDIQHVITALVSEFASLKCDTELDGFRSKVHSAISSTGLCNPDFHTFMERLSQKQDTIRFWYQFVSVDVMAYFGLFIAIRYHNWDLRNGSIKLLAPVFSAFDRPIYQSLIPHHIRDILSLPDCLLQHLRQGCFSVRLTASEWHGVALDECHEMKINKDAKMAVVRPSLHKMEHLSNHLSYRAACVNNLSLQLFPERKKHAAKFSHNPTSKDKKSSLNVERMLGAISNHGLFYDREENNGLWNFLKLQKANSEQTHDLLQFRAIGQSAHEEYINSHILNNASTTTSVRRKRLNTFSTSLAEKRRIKQVDMEARISQRYLKKTVAWLAEHGGEGMDLETLLGPPSLTPKALMDSNGLPYKGTKSSTTTYLERRYKNPPVISNKLPPSWIPHSVILEGMFLIQMSPLPTMTCMEDYVRLLISRYLRPHFNAGVVEVHVVFDVPGLQPESPKEIEQLRRDQGTHELSSIHHCTDFCSDLLVPNKWRSVLGCRACKKNLTAYIADDMLRLMNRSLRSQQQFITNIGSQTYITKQGLARELCPDLHTNADEADLRVWLHCKNSCGTQKLIYSPDTDVYIIGLSALSDCAECDVIVQLSKDTDDRARYLHMTNLITALDKDPDLSQIPPLTRPQTLQSLYVATGCDYTSYFAGLGKVSFLSTFFQHASFITGHSNPPGSMGEISTDMESNDKYSFLRLIGCAYYKKHTSAFRSKTPETLFYSIGDVNTTYDHHTKWLTNIRTTVQQRVDTESKCMPSTEALLLHWKRCVWVLAMWHCATLNHIDLPALTEYGWTRENGRLDIVWEVSENIAKSKSSLDFFLAGCKCKTGCTTRRCSCRKKKRQCGPSCSCHFCKNSPHGERETCTSENDLLVQDLLEEPSDETFTEESDDDLEDLRSEEMNNDEELRQLMNFVFGSESDEED